MLTGAIIVMLIVSYLSYLAYYKSKVAKNLDLIVRQEVILLDVRTKREYTSNHLKDAINIPLGKLKTHLNTLDKTATIITYCSHGIRSVQALNILKNHGFTDVYNGGSRTHLKPYIK